MLRLNEIRVLGHGINTSCKTNKICDEIIHKNTEYTKRLGFQITEKKSTTDSYHYWIPKLYKTPVGARFIIASKICSTKQISKSFSKSLRSYTPKLKIFIKILSSYQIYLYIPMKKNTYDH